MMTSYCKNVFLLCVSCGLRAKKGERKTEEKLSGDHPPRPARTGTDVGRCSRRSGGQSCKWLEETHCPMCCPAREGLRSNVLQELNLTVQQCSVVRQVLGFHILHSFSFSAFLF